MPSKTSTSQTSRLSTQSRWVGIAIVGSSIAAALITPTVDPVNMGLVMGPLLALYMLSIGLVAVGGRFARKRLADVIEPVS